MKLSVAITEYGDVDHMKIVGVVADAIRKTEQKELKRIDMSVCIDSKIDCEFSDNHTFPSTESRVRALVAIDSDDHNPFEEQETYWHFCRPRMDGHIHASPTGWDKCPVPEGLNIKVWDTKGNRTNWVTARCSLLIWENTRMFQVTGVADGWEL